MAMMWSLLLLHPNQNYTIVGGADWSASETSSNDQCCHAVKSLSPLGWSRLLMAVARSAQVFGWNSRRAVVAAADDDVVDGVASHVANMNSSTMHAYFSIELGCS